MIRDVILTAAIAGLTIYLAAMAVKALRTGKLALSNGEPVTRKKNPFWYWLIVAVLFAWMTYFAKATIDLVSGSI